MEYEKLLEVYTLEQIIEMLDLEAVDILRLLDDQGYLNNLEIPVPL